MYAFCVRLYVFCVHHKRIRNLFAHHYSYCDKGVHLND